jgi:hypothetical protein
MLRTAAIRISNRQVSRWKDNLAARSTMDQAGLSGIVMESLAALENNDTPCLHSLRTGEACSSIDPCRDFLPAILRRRPRFGNRQPTATMQWVSFGHDSTPADAHDYYTLTVFNDTCIRIAQRKT